MTAGLTELTLARDILPYASADPVWCAYALGDLEPPFFSKSRWFACGGCLTLLYRGLEPPVLFASGPVAGFAETLRRAPLPRTVVFNVRDDHLTEFERVYRPRQTRRMVRMALGRLRPAPGEAVRLGREDLELLTRFYTRSGMPVYDPDQVIAGVFYGAFVEGELASAGGTHVLSGRHGVAVLGNVYTAPAYRQRGLATAVTSAVAAEVQDRGIGCVVLNVETANVGAARIYARLGFVDAQPYFEGVADRR